MRGWRRHALGALLSCPVSLTHCGEARAEREAQAGEIRLAFARDGRFGAWLVAGPFERGHSLEAGAPLSPRLGAAVSEARWKLAASEGALDLVSALDAHANDCIAYAGGILHLDHPGRHYLLLAVDDGVSVDVDGARVFAREEDRPLRDDDDAIPLDLSAGDHTVVLTLHQHAGAWKFRARLLDAELRAPLHAEWTLPGTTRADAHAAAARMSQVSLDRAVTADGYSLALAVRFPHGAPREVPLDVHARLIRDSSGEQLFDIDAGEVAVDEGGVGELSVAMPHLAGGEVEDDDLTLHVEVGGRHIDFPFHPRQAVRSAIAHADRALATSTEESVQFLRDRLAEFAAKGDSDTDAQLADARELDALASEMEEKGDPWASRTGPMRRAYRSPADGRFSEFALYVPPDFDPERKYPLIVALHGMNGRPMEMLMWLFGHDDPGRDGVWEDRHPRRDLEKLDAIVVAPSGHANTMYRELGEDDVMRVIAWTIGKYPIDDGRVTITGPSMGGIGAAACALHRPDRFAAAAPLCGYHSYFIRGDMKSLRPWERYVAEERSNVLWAENGQYLPMYVVHGTKDLPEENSGVLIERYNELHYSMKEEHPELGHNVWQTTYEDLKGAQWLLGHRRPAHPRSIRFKTPRTRWADRAWVHLRELTASDAWGEIIARIDKNNAIHVATRGVNALALDRDSELIDDALPVTVGVDSNRFVFQAGEPIEMHKASCQSENREAGVCYGDAWLAGPPLHRGPVKHGDVTGPLRDVFHESVLFVWGASDPSQARANEETARGWAHVHPGVRVSYPVMSDTEFYEHGERLDNEHALFLVGNAKSNRVVRELEPSFPIQVADNEVLLGGKAIADKRSLSADRSQLGVAFIRPNPRRLDRYVVVVEGLGPLGTWRSLSLPEMLPDFVVYDEAVAPARGALVLGPATVQAAGFFANDWSLPVTR